MNANEIPIKVTEVKMKDTEVTIRIMSQFHIENGHPGHQTTIQALKSIRQLGIGKTIDDLIRTCKLC